MQRIRKTGCGGGGRAAARRPGQHSRAWIWGGLAGLAGLWLSACSSPEMKEDREAIDIIEKLRADFQVKTLDPVTMTEVKVPFLQPSYVAGGKLEGGRLQATFDPAGGRQRVQLEMAELANGEVRLQADAHPMAIRFAPVQTMPVPPRIGRGYVVFKSALAGGGHLIRALTAHGVEDYAFFAQQPGSESLSYKLVLDDHVAGLRLVNNLIEALDGGGVPRLRVAAPQLIDSTGTVREASLSLADCVADRSLESPIGRPPLPTYAKTCTVTASWTGQSVSYPALVDPSWVSAGTMGINRIVGFSMTWLSNGNVLVAGGLVAGTLTATQTAELYIPSQNAWTTVASMAAARTAHTATALWNGKVLIAGGASGSLLSPTALSSTELFDPATGTWSNARSLDTAGLTPRMSHTASLLPDGRVLVVGGQASPLTAAPEASIYDPERNRWSPARKLGSARYGHTATVTQTGTVFVFGGYSASNTALGSGEVYDATTDSWTATANAPLTGRVSHAATLLPSGEVLLTGGAGTAGVTPYGVALTAPYSSAELYSPGSNRFTLAASLRTARRGHTTSLQPDGTVLAIGGYGSTYLADSETYDVASNRWSSGPTLATARSGHAALVVPNGAFPDFVGNPVVVVAGGNNSSGTAEAYATSTCGTAFLSSGDGSEGLFAPKGNVTLAAGLHQFAAINVASGLRLTASGSGILDLRSLGAATVAGVIDVSGADGAAGIDQGVTNNDIQGANGGGGRTGNPDSPGAPARVQGCPATAGGGLGSAGASRQACAPGGQFGGGAGGAAADGNPNAVAGGGGGYGGGGGGGLPGQPDKSQPDPVYGSKGGGASGGDPGGNGGGKPGKAPKGPTGTSRSAGYTATAGKSLASDLAVGTGGGGGTIGESAAADLAIITTFQPGSGGGGGAGGGTLSYPSAGHAGGGGGGGGGGALRIVSANKLTINGEVKANGGQGGPAGGDYAAGGGGGSGGAIALVGKSLSLVGKLSAAGGVGGAAAGSLSVAGGQGGLGRIALVAYGVGSGGTCSLTGTMTPPASATGVACMTSTPAAVCTDREDACGYAYVQAGTPACTTGPLVLSGPPSVSPGAAGIRLMGSGGTGTGYTFQMLSNIAGSVVGQTSGIYTAGSIDGESDIVAVSDSGGNTASLTIPIKKLTLTAAAGSVPPRGSTTLSASGGGGGPYRYTLTGNASGAPSFADSTVGAYVAGPQSGTDTITVSDAESGSQTVNIVVTAGVSITEPPNPRPNWVYPRSQTQLTAAGGSNTGFLWTIASLDPLIPPNGTISGTGLYTAGPIGSFTDAVTVTDSLGNAATYNMHTYPAVSLTPGSWSLAAGTNKTFIAADGSTTGYTFSLKTNLSGGAITPTGGVYTAGSTKGVVDVIEVRDSLGATATATAAVDPAVTIAPAFLVTYPSAPAQRFVSSGGTGTGYTWSKLTSCSGFTLDADGTYYPGALGSCVDVLGVTDSGGNTARVAVNVGASVAISPTPVSPASALAIVPRDSLQLSGSGGSGTYTWKLLSNLSGATVSGTGLYTAGSTGSVADIVQVKDSAGRSAAVQIAVGPAITISPAGPTLPILGTQTFVAQGGKGAPYTWKISAGSGTPTINASGVYTAGRTGNSTDQITAKDSLGNQATIQVYVQ